MLEYQVIIKLCELFNLPLSTNITMLNIQLYRPTVKTTPPFSF